MPLPDRIFRLVAIAGIGSSMLLLGACASERTSKQDSQKIDKSAQTEGFEQYSELIQQNCGADPVPLVVVVLEETLNMICADASHCVGKDAKVYSSNGPAEVCWVAVGLDPSKKVEIRGKGTGTCRSFDHDNWLTFADITARGRNSTCKPGQVWEYELRLWIDEVDTGPQDPRVLIRGSGGTDDPP